MQNLIYVCGKEEKDLHWVDETLSRVVLDRIDLPAPLNRNALCETRFHLWLKKNFFNVIGDTEFIGLFQASYPRKYALLQPVNTLVDVEAPTSAVAVACTAMDVRTTTQLYHPGMEVMLDEVCKRNHFDWWGVGFMTNSFLAHRTAWYNFLHWFREEFDYWEAKYGDAMPFGVSAPCKEECRPAYFYERLTSLWFSNSGLRITPLIGSNGKQIAFYQG